MVLTSFELNGALGRIRTYDLDVRTVLLYPLSYEGMERVAGIEPASTPWKGVILPLNYTREARRNIQLHCIFSERAAYIIS